jgi:DNA-binding XRE family transcriptional regulator
MIKRVEDIRTPEERSRDAEVQRAVEDGVFSLMTPEERELSIARARRRKEARKAAEIIARDLATLREGANLTQKQLADLIGTNRTDISRLESGRYGGLTVERFLAIIDATRSASVRLSTEGTPRVRVGARYHFQKLSDTIMSSDDGVAA